MAVEESPIAASLNHPNVVPIYDMGSSEGLLYIAMQYVSGTDLRVTSGITSNTQPNLTQSSKSLGGKTTYTVRVLTIAELLQYDFESSAS